jgi:hypothetical protein
MDIIKLKQIHKDTTEKCLDIMLKKNSDYTGGENSNDVFANFRMSEFFDVDPIIGIMMRVLDKIQRIKSFTNDGELKVNDESVYDACEDVVNYAILAKAMFVERRGDEDNS